MLNTIMIITIHIGINSANVLALLNVVFVLTSQQHRNSQMVHREKCDRWITNKQQSTLKTLNFQAAGGKVPIN